MKKIIAFMLLLVALPALAVTGPEQLIRETSDKVLAEIKANADTYKSDPKGVYKLVNEVVLPHFDFSAMTDLALGQYKDEVNAEQRPTDEQMMTGGEQRRPAELDLERLVGVLEQIIVVRIVRGIDA